MNRVVLSACCAVTITTFGVLTDSKSYAANAVGDHCGIVKPSGGATPTATDGLAILIAATKGINCSLCDVDSSGTTVATDTLILLNKVNGQPVTLNCPVSNYKTACTHVGIANKLRVLTTTNPTPNPLLPFSHVVFNCEGTTSTPVVVQIDENWKNTPSVGGKGANNGAIPTDGIMIAGTGRFIEFELTPLCYNRCLGRCSNAVADVDPDDDEMNGTRRSCTQDSECGVGKTCKGSGTCNGGSRNGKGCFVSSDCLGGGTCGGVRSNIGASVTTCTSNTPCGSKGIGVCSHNPITGCPDLDSGGRRFLGLNGDNQLVQDIAVRGFFEGITSSGDNNQILNVALERQCDDSFSNSGRGTVVRGSTISAGCDKCTQDAAGGAISGNCNGDECYHVTYDGVTFVGCEKALRVADPDGEDMLMHVKNVEISKLDVACTANTCSDSGVTCANNADCSFPCHGSELGAAFIDVTIEGGTVEGCDTGWALGGREGQHLITGKHYVTGISDRGVIAQGNPDQGLFPNSNGGTVTMRGAVVQDNGGGNGVPPRGGVAVTLLGKLDLGTSTDPGNNKICRNKTSGSTNRDVHIDRSNISVPARGNYWRSNGNGPAVFYSNGVTGSNIDALPGLTDAQDPVDDVGRECQ